MCQSAHSGSGGGRVWQAHRARVKPAGRLVLLQEIKGLQAPL